MQRPTLLALLVLGALPVAAPQNPFEMPKSKLKGVQVKYEYTGDLKGTGEKAAGSDRFMEHSALSGKIFGRTSNTENWSLITPDSMYHADLTKKTGIKGPNLLPHLAKAYDDLDGAGKTRLHQNMQDIANLLAQAFGTTVLTGAAEKKGTETIAGETCEDHTIANWTVCSMTKAPQVALKVSGSLFCSDFSQTATSVSIGEPPASAFTPPSGIEFKDDPDLQNPDSLARGYVAYLASQELSDSLAAAKAKLAEAQQGQAQQAQQAQPQMTPEQQKQACEALKNFSLGKMMGQAAKAVLNQAIEAKKEEMKEKGVNKVKGLIKKPRFP